MGSEKVSLEKKIEIKTLLQAGFSPRYIGKTFSVSKTCVWSVAKKLKQNLPLSNSPRQGRKRHQQQLMIKSYYVYANMIKRKLTRNCCLNLCFQMENK